MAVAAVVGVATGASTDAQAQAGMAMARELRSGLGRSSGAEQTRPRRIGDARMAAGEASVAAAAVRTFYLAILYPMAIIIHLSCTSAVKDKSHYW